MKKSLTIGTVILSLLISNPLIAKDNSKNKLSEPKKFNIENKEEGWFWYKFIQDDDNKTEQHKEITMPNINFNPIEVLQQVKYMIEYYKALAVLVPTKENIKNYLTVQKALLQHSEVFAKNAKEVIYENPYLDFNNDHPISNTGTAIEKEATGKEIVKLIQKLKDDIAIMFFFDSKCEFSRKQAEILSNFSEKYHITVFPVSADGKGFPQFPKPRHDNGAIKKYGINIFPTIYLAIPKTNQISLLSQGLLSADMLEDRILYSAVKLGLIKEEELPRGNKIVYDPKTDLLEIYGFFKKQQLIDKSYYPFLDK